MTGRVEKMTGWERRKARVRKAVKGTPERPRLNVYRSNKHIYAQIVDDSGCRTILSFSTQSKELLEASAKMKKLDLAKKVGEIIAKRAIEKGIDKVVFDRSGYIYHGRVKALSDGARAAGLKF